MKNKIIIKTIHNKSRNWDKSQTYENHNYEVLSKSLWEKSLNSDKLNHNCEKLKMR